MGWKRSRTRARRGPAGAQTCLGRKDAIPPPELANPLDEATISRRSVINSVTDLVPYLLGNTESNSPLTIGLA